MLQLLCMFLVHAVWVNKENEHQAELNLSNSKHGSVPISTPILWTDVDYVVCI